MHGYASSTGGPEFCREPGSNEQIKAFAKNKGAKRVESAESKMEIITRSRVTQLPAAGASFQLFDKIDVNGGNASPVWQFLKSEQGGFITSDIKVCSVLWCLTDVMLMLMVCCSRIQQVTTCTLEFPSAFAYAVEFLEVPGGQGTPCMCTCTP